VTSEQRLAAVAAALAELGLRALVMGGHAVRFYGVDRATIDFDFCVALDPPQWANLKRLLAGSPLLGGPGFREGPSWRPASFRRFVIGDLPDGKEERLEVWRENHLLAPFPDLFSRRSEGIYGGRSVPFLGLDDLIRSKETEREDDWRDIGLLEEIADEGRLTMARTPSDRVAALSRLRSRRGFERASSSGLLADITSVAAALGAARNPISRAYLFPVVVRSGQVGRLEDLGLGDAAPALREVAPGSARHLALVEAVRRLYRRDAMAADRADKEREASAP
jgi:hypothetical protein